MIIARWMNFSTLALLIALSAAGSPARAGQESAAATPSAIPSLPDVFIEKLEALRASAHASGDLASEADALVMLGAGMAGNEAKASVYFDQALELFARLGDPRSPAVITLYLGFLAEGRDAVAADRLRRAATLAAALPKPFEHTFRRPVDAVEILLIAFFRAAAIEGRPGDRIDRVPAVVELLARGKLAEILAKQGKSAEADKELKRTLELSTALHETPGPPPASGNRGNAERRGVDSDRFSLNLADESAKSFDLLSGLQMADGPTCSPPFMASANQG